MKKITIKNKYFQLVGQLTSVKKYKLAQKYSYNFRMVLDKNNQPNFQIDICRKNINLLTHSIEHVLCKIKKNFSKKDELFVNLALGFKDLR